MQKSSYPFYRSLLWLGDWISLNVIFLFVSRLFPSINAYGQKEYIHYYYVLNLSWLASSYITALYQSKKWLEFIPFVKLTLKTFLLAAFMVFMFVFGYKYAYSRLFIFTSVAAFGLILIANRILFHMMALTARSTFMRKVVVVGRNETASRLMGYFNDETRLVKVVASFDHELAGERSYLSQNVNVETGRGSTASHGTRYYFRGNGDSIASSIQGFLSGFKQDGYDKEYSSTQQKELIMGNGIYEGRMDECMEYVTQNDISEIYCTLSPEKHPELYDLACKAEEHFIHFKFVPDYTQFVRKSIVVDYVEDLPLLSLRKQPLEDISNRMLKRSLDLVISFFVIVFILSWLIPLLAIMIKIESKGPVFFMQLRSGKNNRPFWCIKFRTLYCDAGQEHKQVTKGDHRVTRLGKILRKTNLDEMPQFLNVFIGHMSVVGPRPHMLKHTEEFYALHDQYMIRHFVKPGVTGLAQVKGFRGEIRHPELLKKRVEQDIYYLENWSLAEDLRIIVATIFISFWGDENAY
jgi:putative colanic acid biosynthesis UDP-glucose lipid carrier transferase